MEAKNLQKKCGRQAKQDWSLSCHSNRNVGKLYNQEDLRITYSKKKILEQKKDMVSMSSQSTN